MKKTHSHGQRARERERAKRKANQTNNIEPEWFGLALLSIVYPKQPYDDFNIDSRQRQPHSYRFIANGLHIIFFGVLSRMFFFYKYIVRYLSYLPCLHTYIYSHINRPTERPFDRPIPNGYTKKTEQRARVERNEEKKWILFNNITVTKTKSQTERKHTKRNETVVYPENKRIGLFVCIQCVIGFEIELFICLHSE